MRQSQLLSFMSFIRSVSLYMMFCEIEITKVSTASLEYPQSYFFKFVIGFSMFRPEKNQPDA